MQVVASMARKPPWNSTRLSAWVHYCSGNTDRNQVRCPSLWLKVRYKERKQHLLQLAVM